MSHDRVIRALVLVALVVGCQGDPAATASARDEFIECMRIDAESVQCEEGSFIRCQGITLATGLPVQFVCSDSSGCRWSDY
jgi:hypothetical protein